MLVRFKSSVYSCTAIAKQSCVGAKSPPRSAISKSWAYSFDTHVKFWDIILVNKRLFTTWTSPTMGNAATDIPACENAYTGVTPERSSKSRLIVAKKSVNNSNSLVLVATPVSFMTELSRAISWKLTPTACS